MTESFLDSIKWNSEEGQILVVGTPMAFISGDSFARIQKEAEEITGEDAPIMFYEAGKHTGLKWAKQFKEKFGLDRMAIVKMLEKFFAEVGWGKFFAEVKGEGAILRVENSFIAKNYGQSSVPVCHFIRGNSAGIWSGLYEKEMDSEEIKCMAKGDSHCEFVIEPVD